MKSILIFVSLVLTCFFATGQNQVVYGQLKKPNSKDASSAVAASNIKVLLCPVNYSGVKISRTICQKKVRDLPDEVKYTYTDSQGTYLFSGLKRGVKYQIIICAGKYALNISVPPSGNTYVKVPPQTL